MEGFFFGFGLATILAGGVLGAVSAFFLTEMGRSFYRPYIYAHEIDDWFIADTIGNSFGTVTAVFVILTMSGKGTSWDWRLVGMVLAGLLFYETLNLAGNHAFDVNDVIARIRYCWCASVGDESDVAAVLKFFQ